MRPVIASGYIDENHKLQLHSPEEFKLAVSMFSGDVEIEVRKKSSKRSNAQNRSLWGVAYKALSDYTGYTPEEIHEIAKFKFNRKEYDFKSGEHLEVGGSTTRLNTEEFAEFYKNIQQWAAGLGCVIPDPGQKGWL